MHREDQMDAQAEASLCRSHKILLVLSHIIAPLHNLSYPFDHKNFLTFPTLAL